jgi:serine protease Do
MEARRKQLDSREGVIVTKVDNQGAGGRAGIEPGDIIYQINNHTVRSLRDYNRIIEKIPRGEEILLLIRDTRSGEVGYLTLVTNE